MRGRPASDYTRCPSCGHRTVLFKYGRNGEDYLECTYQTKRTRPGVIGTRCGWTCYRWADKYDNDDDRRQRAAWLAANPGIERDDAGGAP